MKFMKLACVLGFVALLSMPTACGNGNNTSQIQSYGGGTDKLGIADTNPNLPQTTVNPTSRTYRSDAQLIRKALEPIGGIRSSSVRFQGHDALVSVQVNSGINEVQKRHIEAVAQQAVSSMMPRYHVILTVR
jgi:hypothetical protein